MKLMAISLAALLLFSGAAVPRKKLVFFGDSITQMGVNPGGYIQRIQSYLASKSNTDWELIGAGVGGNKVYDLYLRLEEDVLDRHPDYVLIYVGINDVWHKTSGIGTDIEKYEKFYRALIRKMRLQHINVVVCTPSVIGEKKPGDNPQDADLDAYSEVIRKLSAELNCPLVDLRKAFQEYESRFNSNNRESGLLTTDRVHLTDQGNQLVADEIIRMLKL